MSDSRPVRLPDERVRKPEQQPKPIGEMLVGEEGYAVPWVLYVTEERECFLDPTYKVQEKPFGTVQMLVRRTKEGYEVTLPFDARYTPKGVCPTGFIPVVRLK